MLHVIFLFYPLKFRRLAIRGCLLSSWVGGITVFKIALRSWRTEGEVTCWGSQVAERDDVLLLVAFSDVWGSKEWSGGHREDKWHLVTPDPLLIV